MTEQSIKIIVSSCATVHLVLAFSLAVYARHKVQYMGLTSIMAIFAVFLWCFLPFSTCINGTAGVLHPLMLIALTATSFLQSIYPLSIPMPAYLQWGRMIRYALPVIVLYSMLLVAYVSGWVPLRLTGVDDVLDHWCHVDLWWRLLAVGISIYYVLNIFLLPRRRAHRTTIPAYLKGYCTVLSLSVVYYMLVAVCYQPIGAVSYLLFFTCLNMYICFRTFETIALSLPKPVIKDVKEEPLQEEIEKAKKEDFNQANLQYFKRVEFWMQNHREQWTQNTFNRDQLCLNVGINRHLMLQCLRSQGYNSTHEYINNYRYNELRRLIVHGRVRNLSQSCDAGFGSYKTARSVFLQMSGQTLDDFLISHGISKDEEK